MRLVLLALLLSALPGAAAGQERMTAGRLEEVLRRTVDKMEGEAGSWMVYYRERLVMVMADEGNDRMRIFSPIVDARELRPLDLVRLMEANFHTTVDARYGLYEDFVVSLFTHPLTSLTDQLLLDALHQVLNLADTFGSSYSGADQHAAPGEKRINQSPRRGKSG